MAEFVRAALDFPAAVFGLLLIVVLAYWVLVGLGVLDMLTDVGMAVVITFFVAVTWFAALAGTVLLRRADLSSGLGSIGVLVAALLLAGVLTRMLMRPLVRMVSEEQAPTRQDFVGRMCVVRTSRVDQTFGQAEVRAADGSSAVIHVRQQRNRNGEPALKVGSTALIVEYDAEGEFFWVMPYDAELDPHRPPR